MTTETPTRTRSREYNRGWAAGQAAGLDACQPVIDMLQGRVVALLEAAQEVIRLGNQPGMDDDEWEAAMTLLEARVHHAKRATWVADR